MEKIVKPDLSGKEIAKLLLANSRLDANDLKVGLKESLLVATSSIETNDYVTLTSGNNKVVPLSTSTSGNTVSWSDFSDECNAYDFFNSYFVNIESTAQRFATEIDNVKEKCSNTDYWISVGSEKILLQVEANQEIIYIKDNDGYRICRRYTNEDADDVYEMYSIFNDGSYKYQERMLYIAGKRYEFSNNFGGYEGIYIVAENSKGYWRMFEVTDIEKNRANLMCLINTGKVAFTFDDMYADNMPEGTDYLLKFSTTDLTNDIVFINSNAVILNLGAFNGIDHVETDSSNVTFVEGKSNALTSGMGTLVTDSGVKISDGQTFFDGKIAVSNLDASFTENFYGEGNHRTNGHMGLRVEGDTPQEKISNVKAFLDEVGMNSRYNITDIATKVNSANEMAKSFKELYTWNGYHIDSYAGIENAVKVERETYSEFDEMYEKVKNLKSVISTNFGSAFEGWDFAKMSSISCGNVTLDEDTITVENMSAVIDDTKIFDSNEKYTLCLALAKFKDNNEADYDNAVIMECEGADITSFTGGSSITLNQSATFTLPQCSATGKYTIVAYAATEDGIRVSEMVPIIFSEDIAEKRTYDGFRIDFSLNEKKEIRMDCVIDIDVYIKPEDVQTEYTYDEMYELLLKGVLDNGFMAEGAGVEIYDADTNSGQAAQEGATLGAGIYRMSYIKQTDDGELTGYIYFDMNAQ
ncbi:MAG: hypothetical protein E7266_05130 [Lachnospiraceae bacterium]|nr:hypothetical protein [Lachnospiraceae bacterium]